MKRFLWMNIWASIIFYLNPVQTYAAGFNLSAVFGIEFFISFEEYTGDGGVIYRPSGYDFPPSHPRRGFKFDINSQYTSYEPKYDDSGVISVPGRWKQVGDSLFEIYKNGQLEKVVRLEGGPDKIKQWTRH